MIAIHGMSTDTEMDRIRQQLGVCMQDDIIFDKLTAWEHLELFAVIKGIVPTRLKEDISHWLEQVDLLADRNRKAADFSGGMKRKLSFIIAMIGDSPIVILDERMLQKFALIWASQRRLV